MSNNKVVGIIRDENGRLEDVILKSSTNFMYSNELGENVVYSFFEDIEAVASTRTLFEEMIKTVTEKMHEKGIPVKGFIFTKNSVVVLQEDDVTAYIVDWPGAENIKKVNVSVAVEDDDEDDDESGADYDCSDDDDNADCTAADEDADDDGGNFDDDTETSGDED
jgi:hypothetical protein